jgi:hypothetical protein
MEGFEIYNLDTSMVYEFRLLYEFRFEIPLSLSPLACLYPSFFLKTLNGNKFIVLAELFK